MTIDCPSAGQVVLEGGCVCGAVRYRLTERPFEAGYCHCRLCQLSSGAPVIAFGTVRRRDHTFILGKPRKRRSSDFGERWFCGDCGSPLAMLVQHQPATIDVPLATLDHPDAAVPEFHIWTASQVAWFDVADELPRHLRFRPNTPGLTPEIEQRAGAASDTSHHNPLAPPITIGPAS